jgi:hypothetical protein
MFVKTSSYTNEWTDTCGFVFVEIYVVPDKDPFHTNMMLCSKNIMLFSSMLFLVMLSTDLPSAIVL